MKGFSRVHPLIFVGLTMLLGTGLTQQSAAAEHYAPLSLTCGSAKVAMSCKKGTDCTQTVMRLTMVDGKSVMLAKPRGLEDHAAVGMACAVASDNSNYVVVEFGDLPSSCEFCEWFALYDLKGSKLTDNDPAILVDKTMDDAHQQYPNNNQFDELAKKWKLNHPRRAYINMVH